MKIQAALTTLSLFTIPTKQQQRHYTSSHRALLNAFAEQSWGGHVGHQLQIDSIMS
jgi:hypothetical protein